jgi:3-hydroxyacyl-CoA dehydrogenase
MVRTVKLDRPAHQITATVIGAGTMGAGIAAHLANAGCRTHLLDIVPKDQKDRSAIAKKVLKGMPKDKRSPLMSKSFGGRLTPGNIDDHLEDAVSKSDIVIEAVIERLDIKRDLFSKIAAAAPAHCVLATNTSGIPIHAIAEALPDHAKKRLIGMHFFNPPRWMHLLEVIPSDSTDPDLVDDVSRFSEVTLGKGVVPCRDTPNFIGNRIGVGEMLFSFAATSAGKYTVEEVDFLNGPLMGRPKTGSHRLGDLVGLDVLGHVVKNLQDTLSGDPKADNYDPIYDRLAVPDVIQKMYEKNWLGDKTGQGFYKKSRDEKGKRVILSLDLDTLEYRPQQKARFEELKSIRKVEPLERRIHEAMRAEGRAGDFLRKVYLPLFNYAATLTGDICDTPKQIDDAMCWGYGWKVGPFKMWDATGVKWGVEQLEAMGETPAPAVKALLDKHGDDATWYGGEPQKPQVYTGREGGYEDIETPAGILFLDPIKKSGREIFKNSTAALLDIGNGVACLEFRSKMNMLDQGVIELLTAAPSTLTDRGFSGLVVGSQSDDFCVGANIMQMIAWIMQKDWDGVDKGVAALQDALMGLRHAELPVVVAPYGRVLGGGVETCLHGDAIVASADTFMGLVEIGVGVLPAGGGLKEICRRASAWAAQVPDGGDPYEWIRRGFGSVAMGTVSTSAFEARELGYLAASDGITFHKSRVIADAKKRVLGLVAQGYRPPDRNEPISVVGAPRGASFMMGAKLFEWGGYASEHDMKIGKKIAHVLSGGMTHTATTVTAQHLLDLEREAFVSLCGEEKTLARMQHMLEKGKPLRN